MKKTHLKVIGAMSVAAIAALGNIPYGFRFAHVLFSKSSQYYFLVGSIFAVVSWLGNAALCAYSLMSINVKEVTDARNKHISFISILSAIPVGMLTFFGYQNVLPSYINLFISWMVIVADAAIGYHALNNIINNVKTKKDMDIKNMIMNALGRALGVMISFVGYFAAVRGLLGMFEAYQINNSLTSSIAYLVAIIAWVPYAALFANANQQAAQTTYDVFFENNKTNKTTEGFFSPFFIFLVIFSLLSGSAIAQMVLEILSPSAYIPGFLATPIGQNFVHYILAPLSFVGCACVNYFGIVNFLKQKIFSSYFGKIKVGQVVHQK